MESINCGDPDDINCSHIRWHVINNNNNKNKNNNNIKKMNADKKYPNKPYYPYEPPPPPPEEPLIPNTPYMLPSEYVFMSALAIVWFWATVLATFYFGTVHILPALYGLPNSDTNERDEEDMDEDDERVLIADADEQRLGSTRFLLAIQEALAGVMFVEMLVNWICVRFIHSAFKPGDHVGYIAAHASEISNGGLEINMNDLRPRSTPVPVTSSPVNPYQNDVTYSLPSSSVRTMDGYHGNTRATDDSMYIITSSSSLVESVDNGTPNVKILYPYWSWKPCYSCCEIYARSYPGVVGLDVLALRPPRTHHCYICGCCVLKRDHHCFFTGRCVGVKNQRYFVVFMFWAATSITFSLAHSTAYIFFHYLPRNTVWDLFLPFTGVRCLLGRVSFVDTVMAAVFYSLVWFFLTLVVLMTDQWKIIRKGMTSFEMENGMKVVNRRNLMGNVQGVFGKYWALNFIVPLHWWFPATDDGLDWSHIAV